MSLTAFTHGLDPICPSPLCTSPLGHLISHLAASLFPNPPSAPSGSLPLSEGPSLGQVPSWAGVEFAVSHQGAPPLPSPPPASSGPHWEGAVLLADWRGL